MFLGYAMYLADMIIEGEWIGDGRRSSATALNALCGLAAFGVPGLWYAVRGRFGEIAEADLCLDESSPEHAE